MASSLITAEGLRDFCDEMILRHFFDTAPACPTPMSARLRRTYIIQRLDADRVAQDALRMMESGPYRFEYAVSEVLRNNAYYMDIPAGLPQQDPLLHTTAVQHVAALHKGENSPVPFVQIDLPHFERLVRTTGNCSVQVTTLHTATVMGSSTLYELPGMPTNVALDEVMFTHWCLTEYEENTEEPRTLRATLMLVPIPGQMLP